MNRFAALRPALASLVRRPAAGLRTLALFGLVAAAAATPAAAREIVHYQKNMAFGNQTERALANDIIAVRPDTVSLQEVNKDNVRIISMLDPFFPSHKACLFHGIGRVAVFSRWPLINGERRCLKGQGVAAIKVRMPEGPVWVMSVHIETPGKPLRARMVAELQPEIRSLNGPKIIGGDFNALTFESPVQSIAQAANARIVGRSVSTFFLNGVFGIPIDHVMATGAQGSVSTRPMLGSDHLGLVARFTMAF